MTVSELIQPGDKIDVRLAQQVEQPGENSALLRVYKSQVLDIKENGNIVIAMPIAGGKLVLLPLNVRFEFIFFAKGGMYRAIGQIVERYKRENVYMLAVELKSHLEKHQRREFFRYPCILDVSFYTISKEEAGMGTGEALFIHLREDEENLEREYKGQIMDLSGGGARFTTEQKLEEDQFLLFELHLYNEDYDKQFYIVGDVISCDRKDGELYEVRSKFLITDNNIQEDIIRYIFEEERKDRHRSRD